MNVTNLLADFDNAWQPGHAGQHAPEDARKSAEDRGQGSRAPAEID